MLKRNEDFSGAVDVFASYPIENTSKYKVVLI